MKKNTPEQAAASALRTKAKKAERAASPKGRAERDLWRAGNPDSVKAHLVRSNIKNNHGITIEEYEALLEAQGGHCAICPRTEPGGKGRFHVDHDHAHNWAHTKSSQVSCRECYRGLLCLRCNTALGLFSNDPDLLAAAMVYRMETG